MSLGYKIIDKNGTIADANNLVDAEGIMNNIREGKDCCENFNWEGDLELVEILQRVK